MDWFLSNSNEVRTMVELTRDMIVIICERQIFRASY